MIHGYVVHLATLVALYAILAASLNLTMGFTGLLNLGHVAFFGVGAYVSALAALRGVPYPFALLLAVGAAALAGVVLVSVTRRLKGDYLALATLGFGFVVYSVFLNWTPVTRGPLGIPGIPRPTLFGFALRSPEAYLLFTLGAAAAVLLVLHRVTSSRYGRLLEAVRDDELAAAALGKDTGRLKLQSMGLSAGCAGIAGSVFAHYLTYIDPSSFFLSEIILLLTIVMVGGLASLRGSVLASVLIILLPELLRFLPLPSAVLGPLRQVSYALILLTILRFRPRGLLGRVDLV